nr:MAG TPA: hypothetical protein [Bacteriophage sp.]
MRFRLLDSYNFFQLAFNLWLNNITYVIPSQL